MVCCMQRLVMYLRKAGYAVEWRDQIQYQSYETRMGILRSRQCEVNYQDVSNAAQRSVQHSLDAMCGTLESARHAYAVLHLCGILRR
jgi:hypothetical protein